MTIIAEQGVHAVTAVSVGERAGYSRGIVNHQFGTRQALLAAVAETVQSGFDPNPQGLQGREHVLALVAGYLSSLRSEPRDIRVFLRLMTAAISGEEPGLEPVFVQRDEYFRKHLAAAVAEGQYAHTVRGDLDAATTAAVIVGQLRGIALQMQLSPGFVELTELLKVSVRLIDAGLQP